MRVLSSRRLRTAAMVGLITMLLAVMTVVQVRSQAEVERSLAGQDNTSLAFVIDDLHTANELLAAEAAALNGQRAALLQGGNPAAGAALSDEQARLRVLAGLTPVHGPGVVITITAPLSALDLQDAVNNLRSAGAEAISINDRRVVTGTVIHQGSGSTGVYIDDAPVRGPWTLTAIGDPGHLPAMAKSMTQTLKADTRVLAAAYREEADLQVRATVVPRPLVYATP